MEARCAITEPETLTAGAALLARLGHPVRLRILSHLAQGGMCVNHLREALGLSQPNVSQHLLALREAGLVDCHARGSHRCYYIIRPTLVRNLLSVLTRDEAPQRRPPEEVVAEIQARWGQCKE